jgi:fluoride exporter
VRALWVGIAGAAGALTRYGIGLAIGPQRFPWATLGINITGSFVLAFVLTWAVEGHLSTDAATAIGVGFLGAYTTFSTFAWESFAMGHTHRAGTAALYVGISVAGGLAAAWSGYALARAVR